MMKNTSPANLTNTTILQSIYSGDVATGIAVTIIAILAIVGNSIAFALFLYSKKLRKDSHGVLIWNLALVDLLTGIFVIVTPDHIIRDAYHYPPPGLAGEIFCRLIASEIFTFCFGFISMYTLAVLALERRYAVVKSTSHARYFTIKRIRIMVVLVWLWCIILNMANLFQSVYDKTRKPPCNWIGLPGGPVVNRIVYCIMFLLRFLLPMICVVICYANIWRFMTVTVHDMQEFMDKAATSAYKMKTKVTITCAITSLAFLLCWLPNQISFTLINFGVDKNNSNVHLVTKILVLFNSCINPFIYACTNRYYRTEFLKMLYCGNYNIIVLSLSRVASNIPSSTRSHQVQAP